MHKRTPDIWNPVCMETCAGIMLLCIWQFASLIVDSSLIVPSPMETLRALILYGRERIFWVHVGVTAFRSLCAFIISVCIGSLLGLMCALHERFHMFIQFPLALIRSAPVVSFILIAVFWFGSSAVPVFVSVVMCMPVMSESVYKGVSSADIRILEMARVYGFSRRQVIRCIRIPSALPYVFAGMLSCFGLSWKVVAAGEVLTLPRYGTGTLLQSAKVHLNTDQVFAVTLVIAVVSFAAEKLLAGLFRLRKRNNRI